MFAVQLKSFIQWSLDTIVESLIIVQSIAEKQISLSINSR